MNIVLIGASGKLGKEIDRLLSDQHMIIRVGVTSGDVQCDYTDPSSVSRMYEQIGEFDALICVAGRDSTFKPFELMADDDYRHGFERKFLGQLRLVMLGQPYIRDHGSFTLTSGFLNAYPNRSSIGTGPLNSAVDTLAHNIAPLLPRGIRINVVSPTQVVDPGQEGRGVITAAQAADFYAEAVLGEMNGEVLRPWGGLPVNGFEHS